MANLDTVEICRVDLFTAQDELQRRYTDDVVERILRIREEYNWFLSNPDAKDRQFIENAVSRFGVHKSMAYRDLGVVKALLPHLAQASRDFHRYRYNEMILETYQMAKKRKDTKTMEKAASSYAKFNRVDLEDEQAVPYDMIVVQPFTATDDPSVLGIKPMPRLQERIQELLHKYQAENIDIEDVEFEEADLEESTLFPPTTNSDDNADGEDTILQQPPTTDPAHWGQYHRYRGGATNRQDRFDCLALRAAQHAAHARQHGRHRRAHLQARSDEHHPGLVGGVETLGVHQRHPLCHRA